MIAARNPVAAAPLVRATAVQAPAPAPSPLLVAMVAEWEAVGRRINAPAHEEGAEFEALGDWHTDLQRAIYRFPAGSVLDLAAKAPVFQDMAHDAVAGLAQGIDAKDTLPGAAWHGLMRDLDRLALDVGLTAPAAPNPADPILAGIAETRALLGRALIVLADHRQRAPRDDLPPAWFEASDATQEAFRHRVLAVPPTTEAGRQALARLMLDLREGLGLDFEEEITAVLRAVAGKTPAPGSFA